MKKNNYGFTMIEIIGVVIIMGVLLLLIIPGVSKLMAKFRNDYYEKTELTVNESGKDFFADNKIYLPDGILESEYVNASSLISLKYADSLLDYKGNSCELEEKEGEEPKSYTIVVYRGNGKYVYQTCIDCSDEGYKTNKEGTYCDPAWLSNDNIGYDYGKTGDIYFYYGTSRDKIREKLIKSLNVVKYKTKEKKKEDEIDRIAIGEEGILPTNIDIINNKPELDPETNKKEYTMIYGSKTDNNIENLNAIIYKHKAPKVTMKTLDDKGEEKPYDGKTGYWTNQNVLIKLERNDEFFDEDNRKVQNYQWKVNGGSWQNITCDMIAENDVCTIKVGVAEDNYLINTYYFRLVNDEGNISDESEKYTIKIDKIDPELNVTDLTDTVILEQGGTILQEAKFTIKVSDTPSGINYTSVCLDTNCQTFTEAEKTFNYSSAGTISIKTYDKAGNETTDGFIINSIEYCTVTYNGNGGTVNEDSETVECGQSVTLPIATRSGYEFTGWYTSSSGGTKVGTSSDSYKVDNNITLYAQWEKIQTEPQYCTIYYNGNGGYASKTSDTVECGNYVTLPNATRSGYVLDYWLDYDNLKEIGTYGDVYQVNDSSVTVYAMWQQVSGGTTEEDNEDEEDDGGTTIPPHTCNQNARSLNTVYKSASTIRTYFHNVNEYDHWCTSGATTESCIYESGNYMYRVTCSVCGYVWDGMYWCPIHSSGSSIPICDASTGTYTGCDT